MWLEGSQKSRFRGLFQAFAVMGWPEKVLFCRWGHAEAKMRENASSTASVALRRNICTLARTRSGPEFTSRGWRVEASQLLRDNKKLKVFAALCLGLRHAPMTLAIPTFLVRMSLYAFYNAPQEIWFHNF
jgi:hypothetical protein